jgi:hypothetical protein
MKDKFTTYQIAKELKELGFDEPCFATYMKDACGSKKPFEYDIDYCTKTQMSSGLASHNNLYKNDWVAAPTWQDVIDWLEDKHKLFVDVFPTLVSVSDKTGHRFTWDIVDLDDYATTITDTSPLGFLTSKEGRVDAILKAIETIKTRK